MMNAQQEEIVSKYQQRFARLGLNEKGLRTLVEHLRETDMDVLLKKVEPRTQRVDQIQPQLNHPILWLALAGETKGVEKLLAAEPEDNKLNVKQPTIANMLALSGNISALNEYLTAHPKAMNARIVHHLAQSGNIEAVNEYLKKHPTQAENRAWYNETIAHGFARFGHVSALIQYLTENKKCINDKNEDGTTIALCIARWNNIAELNEYLAKYPEAINDRSNDQSTIIHYFAMSGNIAAIEQFILEHPESINDVDANGNTIAILLAYNRHVSALIKFITDHPECYLQKNKDGHTILHWLSKNNIQDAVNITKAALLAAVPLLKSRALSGSEHHEDAITLLIMLSKENPSAAKALEEVSNFHCDRIMRRISRNEDIQDDLPLLQRLQKKDIAKAITTLNHYWWEQTLKHANDPTELVSLQQKTVLADLRLGEFYLGQAQKAPEKKSLFQIGKSKKDELLEKSRTYLDSALANGVVEAHYPLGVWHATKGDLVKACQEFGKGLLSKSYYFQPAYQQLKIWTEDKRIPSNVRCLAYVMIWRYNKNGEKLLDAAQSCTKDYLEYALTQTDCNTTESILLLLPALNLNQRTEECRKALHQRLTALMPATNNLKDAQFSASAISEILSEKPEEFISFALMVAENYKQPVSIRGALLNVLRSMPLNKDQLNNVEILWKAIDPKTQASLTYAAVTTNSLEPAVSSQSTSTLSAEATTSIQQVIKRQVELVEKYNTPENCRGYLNYCLQLALKRDVDDRDIEANDTVRRNIPPTEELLNLEVYASNVRKCSPDIQPEQKQQALAVFIEALETTIKAPVVTVINEPSAPAMDDEVNINTAPSAPAWDEVEQEVALSNLPPPPGEKLETPENEDDAEAAKRQIPSS